ncbi:MAG TPA: hypothetical protein VFJ30_01205 [Phycisphaerae bacterium]|nr:hypothetical protein [Phycisphaerae bacterium]
MARRKDYNDDALVLALAKGEKSICQIARDFGLSMDYVYDVAWGRSRRELYPRIQAAREAILDETRALARRMARAAMARLGRLIADDVKPNAEVQRKAALDIIALAGVGPQPPGPDADAPAQPKATWETMSKLTLETRRRIAKELGGTQPDE